MTAAPSDAIQSVLAKSKVTILVTDSGMGGMGIFADIAARLKSDPIFSNVSLIYYNAWPEQHRGYNRLKDANERVRVFDQVLAGMKRFKPDIIMIACNTLSILYDQTIFSRRENLPVIDIIQFGVDMVFEHLSNKVDSTAVLLGTVTTIASNVHRSRLLKRGISIDRLIPQPCDQLATQIEKGPAGEKVAQMVHIFMGQAANKLPKIAKVTFAALFCTHFGYCRELIKSTLEDRLNREVSILDPNRRMAAYLFNAGGKRRYDTGKVIMRVVSRIIWDQQKIDAIAGVIETRSAPAAAALRNYEHRPNLFMF